MADLNDVGCFNENSVCIINKERLFSKMTNMQASNNQENLTSMLLSPEAKEFIPRQFTEHTSSTDPTLGAGLLGAGPVGQTSEDSILTPQDPINGLPSYMTTCYPFVAGSEPRFGSRARYGGKYSQTMYMQHLHPMTPGMPRNRFPFSPKGYQSSNAWGDTGDMYQHFGSLPNGMPFDGGTYQNGFLQQTTHAQISPNDGKLSSKQTNAEDDSSHVNGVIKHNKTQKSFKQDVTGKKENNHTAKTSSKNSTVQTDFPEGIANATLEEVPNALFNVGLVAYKDHHRPSTRHNHLSSSSSSSSSSNIVNDVKEVGSVTGGYKTVSNGTNPDLVTSGERSRSPSASSMSSRSFNQRSGSKVKDEGQNFVSMQDSVTKVPLVNESHHSVPVTLSYASIAQGKNLSSQNKKQNQVAMVTTAKSCDTVSVKKTDNINKTVKSGKSGGRLGNVNVAEIMEDLERASKSKNEVAKTKNETNQKSLSAYYDQIEVRNTNKLVNNSPTDPSEYKVSGTITSNCACPSGPSLYSKVVEHSKPMTLSNKSQQSQVKGQGYQSVSEGHKSDLDPDKKGQSPSDNNNNNQVENGQIKKKRRRRRRRKKKSGDTNEEEEENEAEEITLHFEDEEEFPDLSGLSNCDTTSSLLGQGSISYSEILRNSNPVQSTKTTTDENSAYVTGASPVKESRTSRKRRKRREVANKAADAEMAEIGLEQHMLELKMKQKLPLAAKKSVSPVRNTATQGVWKLTPSSTSTSSSSSGKKVSLLLPGTVASEPAHASTPHQPNTSAVKQPGILKTSQSANTVSGTSNISAGGNSGSSTGTGKKSKQPITYDLSSLIDAAETKKEQPSNKKDSRSVVIKKDDLKPLNMLDSSAPTLKRGKERETPKTKKPSPLKKVILKEREEKKRLRMLDEDEVASGFGMMPASAFPNSPISAPVGIGVVSGGESDLSQDASFKGSMDVGLGTPASAELSPISQPSPSCMSPISPGASPMSSGVNSPITGTVQQTVKLKIHSRRFREYCNQVLDKEIDNHVTLLLQDLVRFQDKQYHKDPIKAKSKRRFVLGLREVTKHLKLRKIKCVIISPNLEKIQSKGGLDDALNTILELCNDQKVPFIFALGRRALGRACAKLVPVSVVGVFNYEGSEENFRSLVALTEKARDAYREMIVQIEKEIAEHPPRASVPGVPHIFAHMGHSRTPSGCSVISFTSSILSEPISENYPHSEPETDNRGYEIEKDDDDDDDRINDNGKDPYEADDEGGSRGKHKTSNLYSNGYGNSGNRSVLDRDGMDSSVSNNLQNNVNNVQSDGSKLSETNTEGNNVDSDLDDFDNEDDDVDTNSEDEEIDYDDDFGGEGVEMDKGGETKLCSHDISDTDQSKEGEDTVEELPTFIDSVHNFDPFCEILSQHSSKTMENGEDVMSTHSSKTTHSSRTLGDSSGLAVDKVGKLMEPKSVEKVSSLSLKGKPEVDKNLKELRTRSWVKEAQNLHFNDQIDRPKDCDETNSTDNTNTNVSKDGVDVAL